MDSQPQTQAQQILSERSPNMTSPTKVTAQGEKQKVIGMDKMDQMTGETKKPSNPSNPTQQQQHYISPSDYLQSPTTKKLSDLKAKKLSSSTSSSKKKGGLFAGIVGRSQLREQGSGQ